VLGLFNYPTGDVGPDATHEIDIEFARWGNTNNPIGNFTVWPVGKTLNRESKSFPFQLIGDQTTHRFIWTRSQVLFQSLVGCRDDDQEAFSEWIYRPKEPAKYISSQPMPVHINLWLFQGRPPKNGLEVEVVLHDFKFTP
jgi:hypothetical protein